MVGEEAISHGKLEDAADLVATRMQEDGHARDPIGIYVLHPVAPEDTYPLIQKALKSIEDELRRELFNEPSI